MNRDDIISLTREVGNMRITSYKQGTLNAFSEEQLERFAALVAAAEREACAKVCEAERKRLFEWGHGVQVITADKLAVAIRARGDK